MKKINSIQTTEAMAMDVKAKSMSGKVWNLAAGDPNLPVCPSLKYAFRNIDLQSNHRYGSSIGNLSLREKLWKNPNEVILSNGAKQLIYMTLAVTTNPGDEVVLVGPCWTSYRRICDILGLRYTLLIGDEKSQYIPDIKKVQSSIRENTAAVLLNNPNNPTGVVYPEDYVQAILNRTREVDTWLIVDEIYKDLCEKKFTSLRGEEGTVVIDGFSKSYNVTGWRLGYAVGSEEIIRALTAMQSQMSGPPSTVISEIFLEAFENLEKSSFNDYRERIELLCKIPKFSLHRPEAGFYFYLPIDRKWKSSKELCEFFLENHKIALTPGDDYGVERTVRISVASESKEELEKIVESLKEI